VTNQFSTIDRANVTPPKDYARWALLIRDLVAHWVERYGVDEVRANKIGDLVSDDNKISVSVDEIVTGMVALPMWRA
jgi:hypothetical protein